MKYLITLLLVFLFPIRFLIATLPHYDMAWVSSSLLYIEVVLLIMCLVYASIHAREIRFNGLSKALLFLYILYFIAIFYQVMVSPQISRGIMMDVPEANFVFYRDFIIQSLSLLLALTFRKHIDFKLYAKITVVLTFLTFFAYFNKVDFRIYGILDLADKQTSQDAEIITSFTVAAYMVYAFFCNYIVRGEWLKWKPLNILLFYIFSAVFVIGLILTIKRGPILSFFTVCGIFFLIKFRNKKSMFVSFVSLITVVGVFGIFILSDYISDFVNTYASGLIERFSAIESTGGAGRFGSDDSVFSISIMQIKEAPVFGSYFRLLKGIEPGAYPHNIILELLMTGGLLISIPFFILLWKVLRIDIRLIKQGGEQTLPALCFLYVLLSLMTSSSLLFKTEFWVFLGILCSYSLKSIKIRK